MQGKEGANFANLDFVVLAITTAVRNRFNPAKTTHDAKPDLVVKPKEVRSADLERV